jgi:hypothetical protein
MPVPQWRAVSELAEPDALDRTLNTVPKALRWRCPEDILSAPEIEWLQDLTMTSNGSGVLRCLQAGQ